MKNNLSKIEKYVPSALTIGQWLLISSAFSIGLLALRMIINHELSYGFLAWNLFLAFVPYFISDWLSRHREIFSSRLKLVMILIIWLLFIPNSFYILTDLFHLYGLSNGHSWFDLTLVLSFAWNGILLGVLSIRKMEVLLKTTKGKYVSTIVTATVMWLSAFGIYIGRYLRFNSWDVITNPFRLFNEIFELVFNPYDYRYVWAMTFCFAFFMMILYYTIRKVSEAE